MTIFVNNLVYVWQPDCSVRGSGGTWHAILKRLHENEILERDSRREWYKAQQLYSFSS